MLQVFGTNPTNLHSNPPDGMKSTNHSIKGHSSLWCSVREIPGGKDSISGVRFARSYYSVAF